MLYAAVSTLCQTTGWLSEVFFAPRWASHILSTLVVNIRILKLYYGVEGLYGSDQALTSVIDGLSISYMYVTEHVTWAMHFS